MVGYPGRSARGNLSVPWEGLVLVAYPYMNKISGSLTFRKEELLDPD
jgi:hypothetical protein